MALQLHNLPKVKGKKKGKRLGLGHGSGHGKTAGRGHGGQKARKSASIDPLFEGGQSSLVQKLPYKRGRRFTNLEFKKNYTIVNIGDFEKLDDSAKIVDKATLAKAGITSNNVQLLKILGDGDLSKAWAVHADSFSSSAKEKIAAAGGKVVITSKQKKPKE